MNILENELEDELAEEVKQFYDDPLGFVLFAFPWDKEPRIDSKVTMPIEYQEKYGAVRGPDKWAIDFLEKLQNSVLAANDPTREDVKYPLQFSTASGHGIGKTTLVAWLILWIMSTRPYCKGIVTANTQDQLGSKTWAELNKWLAVCATKHWFEINNGRGNLKIAHKSDPENWNCRAQTSREENSESFAGLHSANSTPFYIFDEASGIPDKIFEVREGGTTDGEAMTFDFGNPVRNSGMFYENTVGMYSHRYITTFVDSREVMVTNKERIKEWIEDRGIDSDFCKVRIRGIFPSVGDKQFINSDYVQASMDGVVVAINDAPLVIGVDVARFGQDASVIYPRIGRDAKSFVPIIIPYGDTVNLVGRVIEVIRDFRKCGRECRALFVDGNGVGGGVVDQLKALGYDFTIDVAASNKANNPAEYRYKSDECWGAMREAIREGLRLPDRKTTVGAQLFSELTQREYGFTPSGQINLERKEDMKARGLESPNIADALSFTYAQEVYWDSRGEKPRYFVAGNELSYEIWGSSSPSYDDNKEVYLQRGYCSAF